MRFEFCQSHGEFAYAWLVEYYRASRWGALRLLGGPALAYVGWRLHVVHRGQWPALLGALALGYGIYYALKPLLRVLLIVRQRRRLRVSEHPMVVEMTDAGIAMRAGSAESRLGWDRVAAAGRRSGYFWLELAGGARVVIPLRAIADRAALERLLREQGKLGVRPQPT
ncbi:MAG: hypothetical protein HY744_10350 [Deltaproteobacteria bacterium]|nr:hypothetical protein [Deltaproteobacteria bacterium]